MDLKIEKELLDILKEIKAENKSIDEWKAIESDDMFQTNKYSGGFDAIEEKFTFSYFEDTADRTEYWFECSLEEINKIIRGEILSIPIRLSELWMKAQSTLDEFLYKDELHLLEGKKIERVSYIIANDFDFNQDEIHFIDTAIVIQFENGQFLSWQFEEEQVDNDNFLPYKFDVSFKNILENVDPNSEVIDVSQNGYWSKFLNKPIRAIKIYSQESNQVKFITDLLIQIEDKKVAILSTEEPLQDEDEFQVSIKIGNDWTLVLFDQEMIKDSENIRIAN